MSWLSDLTSLSHTASVVSRKRTFNLTIRSTIALRLIISLIFVIVSGLILLNRDPTWLPQTLTPIYWILGVASFCTVANLSGLWRITRFYKLFNFVWFLGEIAAAITVIVGLAYLGIGFFLFGLIPIIAVGYFLLGSTDFTYQSLFFYEAFKLINNTSIYSHVAYNSAYNLKQEVSENKFNTERQPETNKHTDQ